MAREKTEDLMKIGVAGSLESSDVLITVKDSKGISISIKSIVYDFFKEQIEETVRRTLSDMKIENISVEVEDKGALDYTIRARLMTAIARMEEMG